MPAKPTVDDFFAKAKKWRDEMNALRTIVRGCGLIVNVGHGTISKGYYFTDGIWTERENWVDLLCVPGDYAAEQFRRFLRTRVAATGMPKLDPVFGGAYTRAALCRQYGRPETDRLLLYAPTFNEDLSSVYLFESRFAELARLGVRRRPGRKCGQKRKRRNQRTRGGAPRAKPDKAEVGHGTRSAT